MVKEDINRVIDDKQDISYVELVDILHRMNKYLTYYSKELNYNLCQAYSNYQTVYDKYYFTVFTKLDSEKNVGIYLPVFDIVGSLFDWGIIFSISYVDFESNKDNKVDRVRRINKLYRSMMYVSDLKKIFKEDLKDIFINSDMRHIIETDRDFESWFSDYEESFYQRVKDGKYLTDKTDKVNKAEKYNSLLV